MGKPPAQHGTASKYNAGCRCDDCRAANSAAMRDWRARLRRENFKRQTHGLYSTYSNGCRCDDCRAAFRDWSDARRASRD